MSQFTFLFYLLDIFLLNGAILLGASSINNDIGHSQDTIYLLIFSTLSWTFFALISEHYQVTKQWAISRILKTQLSFLFIYLILIISLVHFFEKVYGISQLIVTYFLFVIFFFAYRMLFYLVLNFFVRNKNYKNYIIIGKNTLGHDLRKYYVLHPELKYRFKKFIEFDYFFSHRNQVKKLCAEENITEIMCCSTDISTSALKKLVHFGLDSLIKVKIISNPPFLPGSDKTSSFPGQELLAIPLDSLQNRIIKRLFDISLSILVIIFILSWFIPIISILIKLTSKGPIFYTQKRHGKKNIPFQCIKFRTMKYEPNAPITQASKHDDRVTYIGRFLRKTSLDESPQFINVLKGDMSAIGPRPHSIYMNSEYSILIHNLMSRHYIKPGITGLAQCLGYRGEVNTFDLLEHRFRLDRFYIENWSFWFDIKILFLTFIALFQYRDKAY